MAEITMRCRAFSDGRVGPQRLRVEPDGSVRVWDPVARHYTLCHSLSPAAQRRARQLAAKR